MLTIRRAQKEDAPIIALLGRITFNETFGHLFRDASDLQGYHKRTFSVPKITNSLVKQNNRFWLAYWEDLPVGYAKLKLDSDSEFLEKGTACQLQKIYVLRDFLSKKIGHRLQDALLKEAAQSPYQHIWLSVLESNDRAIRFYGKNGFRKMGTHDFQIGQEHFVFFAMSKGL